MTIIAAMVITVVCSLWQHVALWRFFRIHNIKINGTLLNINVDNLNSNWLAHLVGPAGISADQGHKLLNVLVIVVVHSANVNQALNGVG